MSEHERDPDGSAEHEPDSDGSAEHEPDSDGSAEHEQGEEDPESSVGRRNDRHDRIRRHPTPGDGNSLSGWPSAKHPFRIVLNFLVIWTIRYSPSLRAKRWLLRRLGATVGSGVSLALTATPDVFWPELITIEDDAIVGYDATILCHGFLQDEYRTGEVVIGERAMIGADAVILAGVEIGHDARVAANSLVTEDVPPGTTVAGVPARPVDSGNDSSASSTDGP